MTQEEEVSKPFEKEYGKGDIVLVASDGKRIECHQGYLSNSSSVFRDMFASAHAGDQSAQAEVKMAESYEQLSALLPFSYPQRVTPTFSDWTMASLRELYQISDKLELLRAGEAIIAVMMAKLKEEPVLTYTFACKHNITLLMDAVRSFVPAEAGLKHLQRDYRDMGAHGLATLLLAWQANKKILLAEEVKEVYRMLMEQMEKHSAMKDQDFVFKTLEPASYDRVPEGSSVRRIGRFVATDRRQYVQSL